jgi:transcriptional regulator with XRE-family HTH domain
MQGNNELLHKKMINGILLFQEVTAMTLGERILILRRRNRMTQRELANEAGLNTNTIARLEQGNLKDLGGQSVVKLARALGTSTDYLLGFSERDPDSESLPAAVDLVEA